jgi:hypothetical protein
MLLKSYFGRFQLRMGIKKEKIKKKETDKQSFFQARKKHKV